MTKQKAVVIATSLIVFSLMTVSVGVAQNDSNYTFSWLTIINGGGTSQAENFSVSSKVGRPFGSAPINGDDFVLSSNLLITNSTPNGTDTSNSFTYLPLVIRSP
ncbi:MAG: hypothetical protein AAF629_22195 [Chloroflexota bacterium]